MGYQTKNSRQEGGKLDLLMYGLPDTEKTLSIAKLQAIGFNPLVIACDPGGMATLQGFDIPYIEIDKPATAFQWLGDVFRGAFNISPYNLICVDGASNFSYMCLKATGENSNDRRLDYARGNIEFRRFIDDVRRLPVNIYINAFETELKESNGAKYFGPMAEGNKFAIQFAGLMNNVFRSFRYQDENKQWKTAVQCSADGIHMARVRSQPQNPCNQFEHSLDVAVKKILNIN